MLDKNALPDIENTVVPGTVAPNFIPVACHYDFDTLLTKNGDLVQIIELTGFEDETQELIKSEDLRESIRKTISECIPDYKFAVYFHTIRSRKDLMPPGKEPFGFADELNKKWCAKNNWDKQLTNTLYISIVRQGKAPSIFNFYETLKGLLFPLVKYQHFKFLDDKNKELTDTTDKAIKSLEKYGARKLTMLKTDKGYMSEQLFFYYQLVHLHQKRTPVPIKDLSNYLGNSDVKFHFNTVEITDEDDKQYAAVFSIKDYQELPTKIYDKLLQLGIQFVVSQCVYFVPSQEAKKQFEDINYVAEASKSQFLSELNDVKDILGADQGKETDYCKHQITITIHSDDPKFFEDKIRQATRAFHDIGIVVVREDFNLARTFWSQLPGNFRYLTRLTYISTSRIAGFTSIHHNMSGSYKGSKWGPPVTLLRNAEGNPYFFNFHNHDGNGNTLIFGPDGAGKTSIMRFFLVQACKLNPRLIYLDVEGGSQQFVESIGGTYIKLSDNTPNTFKINPFDIENFGGNPDLYKKWLIGAIFPRGQGHKQYEEFFQIVVQKLTENPDIPDKVGMLKEIMTNSKDNSLIEGFNEFMGSEKFLKYFSQEKDEIGAFDLDNIFSIDISEFRSSPILLSSYLGIMLQKTLKVLDSKPTIVAFNHAYYIYDNASFSPLFGDWLQKLNEKNALGFITTPNRSNTMHENKQFQEDYKHYGTKIFLSDKYADKYFKKAFDLTDDELHKVKSYDKERRMFMLKQDNDALVLSLDLSEFKEELEILG